MPTVEEIRSKLTQVKDPLMNQDVVSLNMIKNIRVQGDRVGVDIEYAIANYPHETELKSRLENALKGVGGIDNVELSFSSRVSRSRPTEVKQPLPGVKNIIPIYACKGGVGKTTVSVNLAAALSKEGAKVGILDADIHGPNIPLMMGIQDNPKGAPNNKLLPLESHGIQLMSIGFLTESNLPSIWRGPMVHGAIQQLLKDTLWNDLDYLIIDLPPGTGDAQLTVIQATQLAGVVFVTTPQTVSLVDGIKGIGLFKKMNVKVLGMIENMSGFVCPHCKKETDIFSKGGGEAESKKENMPFLGRIPIDPQVVAGGDAGKPIVLSQPDSDAAKSFMRIAEELKKMIRHPGEGRDPALNG